MMNKMLKIIFAAAALIFLPLSKIAAQQDAPYHATLPAIVEGNAPGMQSRLLSDANGVKEYVLVFDKGDEVLSGLTDFARQQHIVSAHFTAIGAFAHCTLAWYDSLQHLFEMMPWHQAAEVVSFSGDIALNNGSPAVHAHASIALSDGSVKGGHVVDACVFPTLELFITVFPTPLYKQEDSLTKLNLIHPEIRK
jgi:uncharacterized protein